MADDSTKTDKRRLLSTSGLPKMRFKHKFMLMLFSLLLIVVIRQGFVFFVIGMLPTIVAYYMDVSKQRYTFRSVMAANLSGMLPYLALIIRDGHAMSLVIMGQSGTWFTVYGAALIGWLLVLVCPMLAQSMVLKVHQAQLARYSQLQKKLEGEWGPEVTQFSGEQPQND